MAFGSRVSIRAITAALPLALALGCSDAGGPSSTGTATTSGGAGGTTATSTTASNAATTNAATNASASSSTAPTVSTSMGSTSTSTADTGMVDTTTAATTDAGSTTTAGGGTASTSNATSGDTSAGGAASVNTSEATATTGVVASCPEGVESTETRPQLDSAAAAEYTVANYLASAGPLGALDTDDWDPTAGLGDPASFTPTFTVAADGSGTHLTVQAALDAASGSERQYIRVEPGTYRETLSLTNSAPPITLYSLASDPSDVVLVEGKSAADAGGTSGSATFTVKSAGFQAFNLTISNDFPTPASGSNLQAVALHTQGDRTVLENVVLHGYQDTLYLDTLSDTTVARVYIKNSFIEGDTDFIFGRATVVIEGSTIHYLSSRKGTGSGIHLAPSTHVNHPYGFLLIACEFTADAAAPSDRIYLGRSWDTSSTTPVPNGQAVIRESLLGAHIRQSDPWAAAATSGRAYSAAGNRLQEYCNAPAP